MKYFRIFWVEKYNRSLEPWMPVQPSLPPRIVTNTCRRARNAQPHLRLLRRFSSCDVQSFHSFWPFGSNDTMFLTTWLFHNSEPKVGLVIKDFFKWFLSQSFIKKTQIQHQATTKILDNLSSPTTFGFARMNTGETESVNASEASCTIGSSRGRWDRSSRRNRITS